MWDRNLRSVSFISQCATTLHEHDTSDSSVMGSQSRLLGEFYLCPSPEDPPDLGWIRSLPRQGRFTPASELPGRKDEISRQCISQRIQVTDSTDGKDVVGG